MIPALTGLIAGCIGALLSQHVGDRLWISGYDPRWAYALVYINYGCMIGSALSIAILFLFR